MGGTRVLFLHDDLSVLGGGERILIRVARIAGRRAQLVLVLLFGAAPASLPNSPFDRIIELKAPQRFAAAMLFRHWRSLRTLAGIIGETRPMTIVAFSYPAAVRAALVGFRKRTPLVWLCQEDAISLLSGGNSWRRRVAFGLLRHLGVSIVCLNHATLDVFHLLGFPGRRLRLIPNEPELPPPAALLTTESLASRRAAARVPDATLVAICVAHLNPVKRHDVLIDAVAAAREAGTQVVLICVGATLPEHAAHATALRSHVERLGLAGHVLWTGEQTDIYNWLTLADVAVLASDHEALPTFLLEASAVGLPLLGSDVPGIRAVIAPEVNGLLFKKGDAAECASRLVELAEDADRRQSLGDGARKRVLAGSGGMEHAWDELFSTYGR